MKRIIEVGMKAGDVDMYDEDAIWIKKKPLIQLQDHLILYK